METGLIKNAMPLPVAMALPTPPVLQPLADVAEYLARRTPCALPDQEPRLFMTLPVAERRRVTFLVAALGRVAAAVQAGMSVRQACRAVARTDRLAERGMSAKTFRNLHDRYTRERDWVVLVNRSKCRMEWRAESRGLSAEFVAYAAQRFAAFKRADGKRQAWFTLRRQWRTGRNVEGRLEAIPGYESGWEQRNIAALPAGWGYTNLLRQIKARGGWTEATRALLHEGEAAAREFLPQILGTRRGLRFLELVTFDDVRTDWLVLDTASGQAVELWLLVARDQATSMALGFVMHPATIREDGKATHLGARHMKQLAGWMLERYPLPPYVTTWKLERGTAGMDEAVRAALGELLGNRIAFSITSMIGAAQSPAGYAEKKKGNSRGKASHESHNRLIHTQGAYIGGQTGNRWDIRPADLAARAKEATEIWELRKLLPEHLRGQEEYPILTLNQAREHLFQIFNEQNARTDHALEGFEEVIARAGDRLVRRMQSPLERAAQLVRAVAGDWTPVNPAVVATFFEHTERAVTVKPNGEIEFRLDNRPQVFAAAGSPLRPGTKALGYYLPDDPQRLYLTDGKGCFLGIWLRRERVAYGDREALAEAMRYTHLARETAREAANQLNAPERERLAAMRAHNAELMRLADFTDIVAGPEAGAGTVGSPVGAALSAVTATVKADSRRAKQRASAEAQAAVADIFQTTTPAAADEEESNPAAAAELLASFRSAVAPDEA